PRKVRRRDELLHIGANGKSLQRDVGRLNNIGFTRWRERRVHDSTDEVRKLRSSAQVFKMRRPAPLFEAEDFIGCAARDELASLQICGVAESTEAEAPGRPLTIGAAAKKQKVALTVLEAWRPGNHCRALAQDAARLDELQRLVGAQRTL